MWKDIDLNFNRQSINTIIWKAHTRVQKVHWGLGKMKLFQQQSYLEMRQTTLTSTRTFAASKMTIGDPVYTGRVVGIEWEKRKGSCGPVCILHIICLITADIGALEDDAD